MAEVYDLYQRTLHRSNAVDFDDLLMLTVQVLERFPEAREQWQQAFRYVLVDEYQDTNHAQYRLLQLLAAEARQRLRRRRPGPVDLRLPRRGHPQHPRLRARLPGAQVIALEQNYRSTNAILDAANAVIENNRDRKPKRLFSELGQGDPVEVVEVEDEHAEARFVAAEIARLVGADYSASEIAVFYRTNAQSRVLEDVLVRQQIPYQVIGGPRFYERAEIKDAVAYLTVLDNPSDAVSLMRIANRPRRGIGDTSLQRLVAHAGSLGISLWEATADPEAAGLATAAQGGARLPHDDGVAHVVGAGARVDELVEAVLDRSGTIEAYEAERTIEARGRDREPAGARRRRARVPGRARGADAVRVPAGGLARLRPGRARRRRLARDADDDPQREGPRVPRRAS